MNRLFAPQIWTRIGIGTLILAILWLVGFLRFVTTVNTWTEPAIASVEPMQAIVVLTGGSERLPTGIELLAAGKGQKLLISGVPNGLSASQILAKINVPQHWTDCCIVLGHAADNTVGNAEETHAWLRAEGMQSLRLVTAHYHMPRSLLIFRAHMPNIRIEPFPVAPDSVHLDGFWQRPGTTSLLVNEYNKYLYALARINVGL